MWSKFIPHMPLITTNGMLSGGDDGETLGDPPEAIGDLREVAVQHAAQQVAIRLDRVVDSENVIVDVAKIDLRFGRQQLARPVGEDIEDFALRPNVPAERQHQSLDGENLGERTLIELDDHALLETVHELVELVEQWEIGVHRPVHDRVAQPIDASRQEVGVFLDAFGDVVDRLRTARRAR